MEGPETAVVAKGYLDAIKSAWLLQGTMLSPSYTMMDAFEKRLSLLLELVSVPGSTLQRSKPSANATAESAATAAGLQSFL